MTDNPIDFISLAAGNGEYEDVISFVLDGDHYQTDYVINEYDFEASYIKALNKASKNLKKLQELCDKNIYSEYKDKAKEAGLLFGAWYALNMDEMFQASLEDWKEQVIEASSEYWNDPEIVPADLQKQLQESVDEYHAVQYKEWINGDHRDYDGVLRRVIKYIDLESVEVSHDMNTGSITISMDAEDARYYVDQAEGCDPLTRDPSDKRVRSALMDVFTYDATCYVNKRKGESEKRAIEYKEQVQRETARKNTDKLEREAHLKTMTI